MSQLVFGGKPPEVVAAPSRPVPAEPTDADWQAIARIDANSVNFFLDVWEREKLRLRMESLADRLDHPDLVNHPKWGEAWNRLTRMEGEMKAVNRRLASWVGGAERAFDSLSPAGRAHVERLWQLRGQPIGEALAGQVEVNHNMPMLEPPF